VTSASLPLLAARPGNEWVSRSLPLLRECLEVFDAGLFQIYIFRRSSHCRATWRIRHMYNTSCDDSG